MRKKNLIVFISNVDESSSVFNSQVKALHEEYEKSVEALFICFSKDTNTGKYYVSIPDKPGLYNPIVSWFYFLKHGKSISEKIIKSYDFSRFNLSFIGRGNKGGLLCYFLVRKYFPKAKLIMDIRGDTFDENYRRGNYFAACSHWVSEAYIYRKFDLLFCVSKYLANKIEGAYPIRKNRFRIYGTVVPSGKFYFNPSVREKYRKKFGFGEEDVVVVYSGNTAPYQNLEHIIQSFSKSINDNLHLFVLTRDLEVVQGWLNKYGVSKNVNVCSAHYSEVTCFLQMSDYGVLIRDAIPTNLASSPTKFGEYVNSGLNVIINAIDSDYYHLALSENLPVTIIESKDVLVECFNEVSALTVSQQKQTYKVNDIQDIVLSQIQDIDRLHALKK